MARLFTLSDLLKTTEQTEIDFSAHLRGLVEWYPRAIDSLFKITHFIGELADSESDRGAFEFFASSHYQQIPYTFWAIYDLTKRGFYLEATILFRSLLEVFVQLRYFSLNPEELIGSIKQKTRIPFQKMFNALSPDFYDKHYRYYSTFFAHGKGGHLAFRFESQEGEKRVLRGNKYDEDSVAFVVNAVLPLLLGFLNFYPLFFPSHQLASENALSEEIDKVESWLERHVAGHKTTNPSSREWYASYEPLCRPGGALGV